jgi:predicted DNA-binding transcriptional regulator YafY
MTTAEVLELPSARPDDFDVGSYAKRSFGAFHNEDEYGEVEWRFSALVAEDVRGFRFHPDQEIEDEEDGSVIVRFSASGHVEMVWALYPWGDNVRVVKPDRVREMIEGYRRGDFPSVP